MSEGRTANGRVGEDISLLPVLRVLWAYRRTIVAALALTVIAFAIGMAVLYARTPKETLASIHFRLTFEGGRIVSCAWVRARFFGELQLPPHNHMDSAIGNL